MQRWVAGFTLASAWLVASFLMWSDSAQPASVATTGASTNAAPATGAAAGQPARESQFVGVSSCAGTACHGGSMSANKESDKSYSLWATRDRHSRAYSVLSNDRSKTMVMLLRGLATKDDARPYEETRCLACHAIVQPSSGGKVAAAAHGGSRPECAVDPVLVDGVSCEACHGAAESWLVEHTTNRFKRDASPNKYAAIGMTNTRDLSTRVELCVKCHIGAPEDEKTNAPLRDMNHDLIAAGHPRLSFEMGAYMANMPSHWNAVADHGRIPGFEAQIWAVGQVASAQAALKLLSSRAIRAADASARATEEVPPEAKEGLPIRNAVWPEFSEYDCYACHHDLRDDKFRRDARPGRQLGTYAWGTWYTPMTRFLSQRPKAGAVSLAELDKLVEEVGKPWPEPKTVVGLSQSSSKKLDSLARTLKAAAYSAPDVDSLLTELAGKYREPPPTNWDEWAQFYLAVVALQDARLENPDHQHSPRDEQVQVALESIREKLKFPADDRSETAAEQSIKFDSPRAFDPEKLSAEFQKLIELLQKPSP